MEITQVQSFVMQEGNEAKTDSRKVAKQFGKQHKHVLRDIRRTMKNAGEEFARLNFGQCFEINELSNGKPEPFYTMTYDGFVLLVMGYTGKQAMQIKVAYINAFNKMREFIANINNTMYAQMIDALSDLKTQIKIGSFHGRGLNQHRMAKPLKVARVENILDKMQLSLLPH